MKETYYATVTSKGQITVPKVIRETLAVYPGDKVAFTIDEGTVAVEGISTDIEDLIGSIKQVPGAGTSDLNRIREEAWEEVVQDRIRRMNDQ